jgi:hypothetical protein
MADVTEQDHSQGIPDTRKVCPDATPAPSSPVNRMADVTEQDMAIGRQ